MIVPECGLQNKIVIRTIGIFKKADFIFDFTYFGITVKIGASTFGRGV